MTTDLWRPTREWDGEIAFIVAGGPSVLTQDLELLRDKKVIAVNSSHEVVPWAQFCVFADARWFWHYRGPLLKFQGKVISACMSIAGPPPLHRMHRKASPGLSDEGGTLAINFTTVTAAINLAVHLGARAIVLLGCDGKPAANGKLHHHADHPWRLVPDAWEKQKRDLRAAGESLKQLAIPCVNASPGSALAELWPVMELPEAIERLNKNAYEHMSAA